jgi:hypothetical protein
MKSLSQPYAVKRSQAGQWWGWRGDAPYLAWRREQFNPNDPGLVGLLADHKGIVPVLGQPLPRFSCSGEVTLYKDPTHVSEVLAMIKSALTYLLYADSG